MEDLTSVRPSSLPLCAALSVGRALLGGVCRLPGCL